LQAFKNIENVAREKKKIIQNIPSKGWAILNADDELVREIKNDIRAKVVSYGLKEGADVRAIEIELDQELRNGIIHIDGLRFKVSYAGSLVPVFLLQMVSYSQIYAVLAAIATGTVLGLNVIDMADVLRTYQPPKGRMNSIRGIKNSLIIDDTYNSSPLAVKVALNSLNRINIAPGAHRWAVLGDMLDLGSKEKKLHYEVGEEVVKNRIDYLVTYGELSHQLAERAREAGMAAENIFEFDNKEQLIDLLKEKIGRGDLLLVKGSQEVRMEKVVAAIISRPERASKLLVRQNGKWLNES